MTELRTDASSGRPWRLGSQQPQPRARRKPARIIWSRAMRHALIALAGGDLTHHARWFVRLGADPSEVIVVRKNTLAALIDRGMAQLIQPRPRHALARITRAGRERAAELLSLEAELLVPDWARVR